MDSVEHVFYAFLSLLQLALHGRDGCIFLILQFNDAICKAVNFLSVICIERYNIVKYDASGEVWNTPITQGDAEYIFKIGEEYWGIGTTENYSSKQIIRINERGDILELKDLSELTQDMIHPFLLDNELYAIMESGRESPLGIVRFC